MGTSNSMVGGGTFNETGYHGEGMLIAIWTPGVDIFHGRSWDTPEEARFDSGRRSRTFWIPRSFSASLWFLA